MLEEPTGNNNFVEDPAYQTVSAQMKKLIDKHLGKFSVENITVVQ